MNKFIYISIFLATLLVGCDKTKSINATEMQEKIKTLEEDISKLQSETFLLKMNQDEYKSAVFDPANGKSYQRIDTTSGTFLISIQDVSPHLDGVKIKLDIGNIQQGRYNNFKLKIKYGQRYPKYDPKQSSEERKKKLDEYERSERQKEESFPRELKEGSWNSVTVLLPDIKPNEFGRLEVSMTTSTISLRIN